MKGTKCRRRSEDVKGGSRIVWNGRNKGSGKREKWIKRKVDR
jgi:hypothetical protein